ncbi:transcription antitermination factor NusB [Clostridiales bacterium COT073_COT-073]|nr:transcription antitermination factor NusB [Clostridiales bacterium COT073_COT-073]
MKLKEKRELLFRLLFGQSFHVNQCLDKEEIEVFTKEEKAISEADKDLVLKEIMEIKANLPEIDERIDRKVERWNTKTMARVELAILRLMVYELFYKKETPVRVLANDAVRLATSYGQEASYRFVNGALAKILEELPNEEDNGQSID